MHRPDIAVAADIGRVPAISTSNTVIPCHIAADVDLILVVILGVVVAKEAGDEWPILQTIGFVLTYLGYYFLFEALFGRTPGKFFAGLVVVRFDGTRSTWRQALIRTGFRLLEVNPILLGALPAALSIFFSQNHQRFGDRVADTVVVPARRVPKKH